MLPLPPRFTLFPYTTLFRSSALLTISQHSTLGLDQAKGQWAYFPFATHSILTSILHMCSSRGPQLFKFFTFYSCLVRSEEHTSELQSLTNLVCRLLLEKKKT